MSPATGENSALTAATPAQQAAAAAYGPTGVAANCVPASPARKRVTGKPAMDSK